MTPIWTVHPIMMTLPHQIIIFLAANSAIMRKWKWLFRNIFKCKNAQFIAWPNFKNYVRIRRKHWWTQGLWWKQMILHCKEWVTFSIMIPLTSMTHGNIVFKTAVMYAETGKLQNNHDKTLMHKSLMFRKSGSGGIRTHAPERTGALNQRLRPLGHATCCSKHHLPSHIV